MHLKGNVRGPLSAVDAGGLGHGLDAGAVLWDPLRLTLDSSNLCSGGRERSDQAAGGEEGFAASFLCGVGVRFAHAGLALTWPRKETSTCRRSERGGCSIGIASMW